MEELGEKREHLLALGRALTRNSPLEVVLEQILDTARGFTGARLGGAELPGLIPGDPPGCMITGAAPDLKGGLGGPSDTLSVPVEIDDHPRGRIFVAGKKAGGSFDDRDAWTMRLLAGWTAVVIHKDDLLRDKEKTRIGLERSMSGLEASADIAFAIAGETELERILTLIARRARVLVGADSLLILLRDESELRVAAHAGAAEPERGASVPIRGSTAGRALVTQQPQLVDDVQNDLGIPPASLGAPDARTALIVPLVFRGRSLGVLFALDHTGAGTEFDQGDERSLRAFATSAATAVFTTRTVEERRLRDSVESAEAERKRWARNLHDETLQGLGGIKLTLDSIGTRGNEPDRAALANAIGQVDSEIAGLRQIINDLRPAALDELGLEPALRTLVAQASQRHGLEVEIGFEAGLGRLPSETESVAYRVAQEALTNVVRHSGADRARIEVGRQGSMLRLCVADDGCGFDQEPNGGFGLLGMWERATLAGGEFEIENADPGTRVVMLLPVAGDPVWP